MYPSLGPKAGGTKITISGNQLDIGGNVHVLFDDILECRDLVWAAISTFIFFFTSSNLLFETLRSSSSLSVVSIRVLVNHFRFYLSLLLLLNLFVMSSQTHREHHPLHRSSNELPSQHQCHGLCPVRKKLVSRSEIHFPIQGEPSHQKHGAQKQPHEVGIRMYWAGLQLKIVWPIKVQYMAKGTWTPLQINESRCLHEGYS